MQVQHTAFGTSDLSAAIDWKSLGRAALIAAIVLPGLAMAADGDATQTACGFLKTVKGLLNAVSIAVVTIAIIFSGYQIAFAHKRIGDVAPVFIGAILIGAAGQIANIFLKDSSTADGQSCQASIVPDALNQFASLANTLAGYIA
jgi:type IV secretion system protein VirB2